MFTSRRVAVKLTLPSDHSGGLKMADCGCSSPSSSLTSPSLTLRRLDWTECNRHCYIFCYVRCFSLYSVQRRGWFIQKYDVFVLWNMLFDIISWTNRIQCDMVNWKHLVKTFIYSMIKSCSELTVRELENVVRSVMGDGRGAGRRGDGDGMGGW